MGQRCLLTKMYNPFPQLLASPTAGRLSLTQQAP